MNKVYKPSSIQGAISNSYGIYEGVFFKDGLHLGYDVRYTPSFNGLCTPKQYFVEQVVNKEGEFLERKFPSEEYKKSFQSFIFDRKGDWVFDESNYELKGERK